MRFVNTVMRASFRVTNANSNGVSFVIDRGLTNIAVTGGTYVPGSGPSVIAPPPLAISGAAQDMHLNDEGRTVSLLLNRPITVADPAAVRDLITLTTDVPAIGYHARRRNSATRFYIPGAALQADGRTLRIFRQDAVEERRVHDRPRCLARSRREHPSAHRHRHAFRPAVRQSSARRQHADRRRAGHAADEELAAVRSLAGRQHHRQHERQRTVPLRIHRARRQSLAAGHVPGEHANGECAPDQRRDHSFARRAAAAQSRLSWTRYRHGIRHVQRRPAARACHRRRGQRRLQQPADGGDEERHHRRGWRVHDRRSSVGPFTLSVVDVDGNISYAANQIHSQGELLRKDLVIRLRPFPGTGTVRVTVRRSDISASDPHSLVGGAHVGVFSEGFGLVDGFTDAAGRIDFTKIPAGTISVLGADFDLAGESIGVEADLHADSTLDEVLTLNVPNADLTARATSRDICGAPFADGSFVSDARLTNKYHQCTLNSTAHNN